MSDSNRVSVSLIEEATYGTTPTTPTFIATRCTGESLDFGISTKESEELRSDRNTSDLIRTDYNASGGFGFEWSFGTFDSLLESALCGAWASEVLKNGTEDVSFSIERGHLDINQFFLFTGMMVDTFSLEVAAENIITGDFKFLGKTVELGQTTAASVLTAASSTDVMAAMANVADIKEDGVTMSGVYINKLSLAVKNNLRARKAIGSSGAVSIGKGTFECSGSIDLFFANESLYDKFIAGADTSLSFKTVSGSDDYVFSFPKVKFASSTINASGLNTDVMQTMEWRAIYDSSEDCSMSITRSA